MQWARISIFLKRSVSLIVAIVHYERFRACDQSGQCWRELVDWNQPVSLLVCWFEQHEIEVD